MKQDAFDFAGPFAFDPRAVAVAPSEHVEARETSALAAVENMTSGRKATQAARILDLIRASGERGISDEELRKATGYKIQSICARRGFDLKSLIEPAGRYKDEMTKQSYTRWRVKR